jgi:hypothetical protein
MNVLVMNLQKLLELLLSFLRTCYSLCSAMEQPREGRQCSWVFKLLQTDLQDPGSTRESLCRFGLGLTFSGGPAWEASQRNQRPQRQQLFPQVYIHFCNVGLTQSNL